MKQRSINIQPYTLKIYRTSVLTVGLRPPAHPREVACMTGHSSMHRGWSFWIWTWAISFTLLNASLAAVGSYWFQRKFSVLQDADMRSIVVNLNFESLQSKPCSTTAVLKSPQYSVYKDGRPRPSTFPCQHLNEPLHSFIHEGSTPQSPRSLLCPATFSEETGCHIQARPRSDCLSVHGRVTFQCGPHVNP